MIWIYMPLGYFPKWLHKFTISTAANTAAEKFIFPHSHQHLLSLLLFNFLWLFIGQLHSAHMLVMIKISKPGFNSMWTVNFHMLKLDLEKKEEPGIKSPTSLGPSKKRVPEKHLLLLYWPCQSLSVCGSQQTVKKS